MSEASFASALIRSLICQQLLDPIELFRVRNGLFWCRQILDFAEEIEHAFFKRRRGAEEFIVAFARDGIQKRDEASRIEAGLPGVLYSELICFPLMRFAFAIECASEEGARSFNTVPDAVVGARIHGASCERADHDLRYRSEQPGDPGRAGRACCMSGGHARDLAGKHPGKFRFRLRRTNHTGRDVEKSAG